MLRKNILDIFGAGFLVVGTDTAGSYNLAEAGIGIHGHFLGDYVEHIRSIFQKQLIPQILKANGFNLNHKDIPKLIPNTIGEYDIDETSKMVQRMRATNSIILTKENMISWHERSGFPTEHLEQMTEEEMLSKLSLENDSMQSRSGDGMDSGMSNGVGDKVGTEGGDTSVSNNENMMKAALISDDGVIAKIKLMGKELSIPSEDIKDWIV